MARTFGAQVFYGAENLNLPTANNGVGAGQYAWTLDANNVLVLSNTAGISTVRFFLGLADFKRPYITFPAFPGQGTVLQSNEFQEVFGTAAGGPSNPFSGVAAGTTATTNPNQTTQFGTPSVPWGLSVIDVFAVYSVVTAALTTATLAVNRVRFGENVAYGQDAVLAATGIALTTTAAATQPHVQKVALAQPLVYEVADFSNLAVQLLITTAGTSAVALYGIGLHCAVEFS
jgi:hypothetical protein